VSLKAMSTSVDSYKWKVTIGTSSTTIQSKVLGYGNLNYLGADNSSTDYNSVYYNKSATTSSCLWYVMDAEVGYEASLELRKSFVTASNYNWSNVKIGGGGFVSGVIVSPGEKNQIYARTDVGGAYKWIEETQKWKPLLDWASPSEWTYQGVLSVAIDPQATNKVYMLVGSYNNAPAAIVRSLDYGENFKATKLNIGVNGNAMGRGTGERLMVDPNLGDILFCGTQQDGLWKSADAGVTWSKVTSFPVSATANGNGICFVVFDQSSGTKGSATSRIYVGCSQLANNLYVSEDAGATWTQIAAPSAASAMMPQRAVITSDGSILYATFANGAGPHGSTTEAYDTGGVFKYTAATSSWTTITPPFSAVYSAISLDKSNEKRLLVSTINSWSNQQFWDDNTSAWGDRIFLSTNGGSAWTNVISGTSKLVLNRNGFPWISGHNLHWVSSVEFDPFNSKRFFATSGNGIFMTDNMSATGVGTLKFAVDGLEETVPGDMASVPNGPFITVIGDYDGFVHDDVTVSPAGGRYKPQLGTSIAVAYAPQATSVFVRAMTSSGSASSPKFYYSKNSGVNWTGFSSLPCAGLSGVKLAVSADGAGVLVISSASDTLYYTNNWGKNWTKKVLAGAKDAKPMADPLLAGCFYVYTSSTGYLYQVTADSQSALTSTSLAFAGAGGSGQIGVSIDRSADIWVALRTGGLLHYDGSTKSSTKLNTMSSCAVVTLGKAASGTTYPALYIWGVIDGTEGLFRSLDKGETWVRVNNDKHQYGGLGNAGMICGDWNVFGRVYMSSLGRGFAYGQPSDGEGSGIKSVFETTTNGRSLYLFSESLKLDFEQDVHYTLYSMDGRLIEKGCGSHLSLGYNCVVGAYYNLDIRTKSGEVVNTSLILKQ